MEEGKKLLKGGKFEEAKIKFQEVLSLKPDYEEAKRWLEKAEKLKIKTMEEERIRAEKKREKEIEKMFTQAYRHYRKGEFEEAISGFETLLSQVPEHKDAAFYLKLSKEGLERSKEKEKFEKESVILEEKMKEAKYLYNTGKFDKAIEVLEEILSVRPDYAGARALLEKAKASSTELKEKLLQEEQRKVREEMMEEIEKAYVPPKPRPLEEVKKEEVKKEEEAIRKMKEKAMQKVTLEFTNADLRSVILFLSKQTGINMLIDEAIFEEKPAEAAPAPQKAPAVPPEAGGPPGGGGAPGAEIPPPAEAAAPPAPKPMLYKITCSLKDVPLLEALGIILRSRGLDYVIMPNLIWISTRERIESMPLEPLVEKVFDLQFGAPIRRAWVQTVPFGEEGGGRGYGGEGGGAWGGGGYGGREGGGPWGGGGAWGGQAGGGAGAAAGGPLVTTPQDIKSILEEIIPQPPGSKMILIPAQNKLIVKNTPTNIKKIEEFLRTLATPPQVSIEARFMLMGRDTMRDVGVELQNLSLNVVGIDQTKGRYSGLRDENGNLLPWVYDTLTGRIISAVAVPSVTSAVPGGGLTLSYARLNYPQFSILLQLLSMRSDVQTLSAPKVTTINNEPAIIRFVKTIKYVSDVDTSTSTTGTGAEARTTTTYSYSFEERDVGIILNVTPLIIEATKNVMLFLQPIVSDIEGWRQLPISTITDAAGHVQVQYIEIPIFTSKDVVTNVTVHDGDTVVLGGLMSDVTTEVMSKVPFLGDIPVIGKAFFQRKSSTKERKNLVIFITVRILSETGAPLYPEREG